jgi:RimJ/RimL family protein N-acetyltransferase
MAVLVSGMDIAIGAAGVSMIERCCLGVPSILMLMAENQHPGAEAMHDLGGCINLGNADDVSVKDLRANLARWLENKENWKSVVRACLQVADGFGATRVARIIDNMSSKLSKNEAIYLVRASPQHQQITFDWQKNPITRKYSRNKNIPDRKSHAVWFRNCLCDPGCIFNIIMKGERVVGVLRFDRILTEVESFEVSISVDPQLHRRGIAARSLEIGTQFFKSARLWAWVDSKNLASLRLFKGMGYCFIKGNWYCFSPKPK